METKTRFLRPSGVEWTDFGNSMAWEEGRFILLGEDPVGEKEKAGSSTWLGSITSPLPPLEGLIHPQADVWLWHSCQALPAWMTWMARSGAAPGRLSKNKWWGRHLIFFRLQTKSHPAGLTGKGLKLCSKPWQFLTFVGVRPLPLYCPSSTQGMLEASPQNGWAGRQKHLKGGQRAHREG